MTMDDKNSCKRYTEYECLREYTIDGKLWWVEYVEHLGCFMALHAPNGFDEHGLAKGVRSVKSSGISLINPGESEQYLDISFETFEDACWYLECQVQIADKARAHNLGILLIDPKKDLSLVDDGWGVQRVDYGDYRVVRNGLRVEGSFKTLDEAHEHILSYKRDRMVREADKVGWIVSDDRKTLTKPGKGAWG